MPDIEKWIPSRLVLENGQSFPGLCPPWQKGPFFGEAVFTTGMTGYPESLTDPSYKGQILAFTYPLIGNYGIPPKELWESDQIHASGVVVNESCIKWSHASGTKSFSEWLKEHNIPLLSGVDTRALTKILRSHGTMRGAIVQEGMDISFPPAKSEQLISHVSKESPILYGQGEKVVVAIDCGMKENIIRSLSRLPIKIKRVPYNYNFLDEPFDGVFLSNGPGDPAMCLETIEIVRKALEKEKPVFGICLGAQIMALAAGAKTYKLPFGHRGQNHPCMELKTKRCFITSQNHGYAIDEKSLPSEWEISFRSLNDDSVEGISHKKKPFFAVQFHPEAAPGPTDTKNLFEKFFEML